MSVATQKYKQKKGHMTDLDIKVTGSTEFWGKIALEKSDYMQSLI